MPEIASFPAEVLVVDDEDVVLEIFGFLFEAHGMPMRTAARGDQAIELLRTSSFGCLLTDKNLPGADGLEVIRAARREQPWCPCILMTAYANVGSAIDALRLGATDYLEKPFPDLEQVVARVQDALRRGQAEFERDLFLRRLRETAGALPASGDAPQPSYVELLERFVESRVARATEELRCRCERLESRLQQVDALHASAEALLQHVRGAEARGAAPAPDALDRIARALEQRLAEHPGVFGAAGH